MDMCIQWPMHQETHNTHEQNYAITELGTLALVWALSFVHTFWDIIAVFTDHSACSSLLKSHPSAKLARWAMSIQNLDLDIKYRSGKSNINADALSRNYSESDSSSEKQQALCREVSTSWIGYLCKV